MNGNSTSRLFWCFSKAAYSRSGSKPKAALGVGGGKAEYGAENDVEVDVEVEPKADEAEAEAIYETDALLGSELPKVTYCNTDRETLLNSGKIGEDPIEHL